MSTHADVAVKVQRRRYLRAAGREIAVHLRLREHGASPDLITLHEAFMHDGHVCMAYERFGGSLETALERGPLPVDRVQRITRQLLRGLTALHACDYAHTDVKPDNIFYRARAGEVRLGDLGSASQSLRQGDTLGTREYTPPEVLIGSPLSPAIDLWSLGCTVYEMLTGRLLFCPRRAAARKYVEFSAAAPPVELATSVVRDAAEERAEQLRRGACLAGRYVLRRRIGQGRFGTVWSAQANGPRPGADESSAIVQRAREASRNVVEHTEHEQARRAWQDSKGASDLFDLTLNYEHVLLIAALCGPFPPAMLTQANFRASYFQSDGENLRFDPRVSPQSLRARLRRNSALTGAALGQVRDFLHQLLAIDPAKRPTAAEALQHAWLRE